MSIHHSSGEIPGQPWAASRGLSWAVAAAVVLVCSGPALAKGHGRASQHAPAVHRSAHIQHAPVAHHSPGGHARTPIAHRAPISHRNPIAHHAPVLRRPPVAHHAPRVSPRAPIVDHAPSVSHRGPVVHHAPSVSHRRPIVQQAPVTHRAPIAHRTPSYPYRGSVAAPRRPGSSYSGFHTNPAAIAAQNSHRYQSRDYANSHSSNRHGRVSRNSTYVYAPLTVTRDWDRGQDHSWNHHRFRWHNGIWVLNDLGFYSTPTIYAEYYTNPAELISPSPALVRAVQIALDEQGYDAGEPDGVFGPQTQDALRLYQDDHGLLVTGWIDQSVVDSLGIQA
jgi:hypothetical protein